MEPVLAVTLGAILTVGLTNLVWWRSSRTWHKTRQNPRGPSESQILKAELVGLHLALIEAVRPTLGSKEVEPSTPLSIIERLVRAHRSGTHEARQLRAQLHSATRRLAGLKRENAQKRQQNGMKEMHQHLAQVSSERDALQEKVTDLTVRVRRSNPTTQDALHAARQEIDRLREQLRAANRAITALDTGSDETGTDDPRLTTLVSVELEDHPTDPSREDLSAFALGIAASQPGSNWGP